MPALGWKSPKLAGSRTWSFRGAQPLSPLPSTWPALEPVPQAFPGLECLSARRPMEWGRLSLLALLAVSSRGQPLQAHSLAGGDLGSTLLTAWGPRARPRRPSSLFVEGPLQWSLPGVHSHAWTHTRTLKHMCVCRRAPKYAYVSVRVCMYMCVHAFLHVTCVEECMCIHMLFLVCVHLLCWHSEPCLCKLLGQPGHLRTCSYPDAVSPCPALPETGNIWLPRPLRAGLDVLTRQHGGGGGRGAACIQFSLIGGLRRVSTFWASPATCPT